MGSCGVGGGNLRESIHPLGPCPKADELPATAGVLVVLPSDGHCLGRHDVEGTMKFERGDLVRIFLKTGEVGGLARVTAPPDDGILEDEGGLGAEHYVGSGYVHVTTSGGHNLLVHEDDLILDDDLTNHNEFNDPRTAAGMKGGLND